MFKRQLSHYDYDYDKNEQVISFSNHMLLIFNRVNESVQSLRIF